MNTKRKNSELIAESVTYLHPDKICDQVSDVLLDAYLRQDPYARVAIEAIGGHGRIALFGEVTSDHEVDHETVVRRYYKKITGQNIEVSSNITKQSPEISQGVNQGGAGDQGIMVGYACSDNELYLPQEMYLCRQLLDGFDRDGKSQVTIENGKITSLVLSVQGKTQAELRQHIKNTGIEVDPSCIYVNNTGSFEIGGFEADSGCTGRKIVVDAYGPRVPVGGGAFSGKDATKVDRSAAYMARWIAIQLLNKYGAEEVIVKLGYVIGHDKPLIKDACVDGQKVSFDYDCRPLAIIERFNLRQPIYADLAKNGHFGRKNLKWEQMD